MFENVASCFTFRCSASLRGSAIVKGLLTASTQTSAHARHIRSRNTQLSARDLIKYDRCSPLARYCGGIYEHFPDG
jgi:hypothetical protein